MRLRAVAPNYSAAVKSVAMAIDNHGRGLIKLNKLIGQGGVIAGRQLANV